jgi:mannose-1-phosphate guanylyltransferase/mannose-6-phosphate isomerase
MISVTPVILCGGSGTRLWPLSRTGFPKQFLCLTGKESLFQQAALRLANLGNADIQVASPMIVTGEDHPLVKMKNFATSKNEFGYVYVLTPTGMTEKAAITHRFLQRKMDEYEALMAEIEALKAEVKNPDQERAQKA